MILAPPDVAAHAAEVQPGTLRVWVNRGKIPAPINGMYDLHAIMEWVEDRKEPQAEGGAATRGKKKKRR